MSADEALPLDLFDDEISADNPVLTLPDFGLDTWADELAATFASTDTVPQLLELVFDDPLDDWFGSENDEEELVEPQPMPHLPELVFDEEPLCDLAAYEDDGLTSTLLMDFLQGHSITESLKSNLKPVTEVCQHVEHTLYVTDTLQLPYDLDMSPEPEDLLRQAQMLSSILRPIHP